MLLRQIVSVINGVTLYCKYIRNGTDNALKILDEDLKESVYALNSYAKYIRDNNLQALQAPNYNLESSVSVEKYLIGYSYLLERILENYNKSSIFAFPNEERKIKPDLIPVMIPQAANASLAIKVMFPILSIDVNQDQKRLMVVECPNIRELANVPEIVAILFHEVAHQFRYESRENRNRVIIRYCISLLFDRPAKNIAESIKRELPSINRIQELQAELNYAMTEAYISVIYPEGVSPDNTDLLKLPLSLLCQEIVNDYDHFLNDIENVASLLSYKSGLIERVKHFIDLEDETIRHALIELSNLESLLCNQDGQLQKKGLDSIELYIKCISDNALQNCDEEKERLLIENECERLLEYLSIIRKSIDTRSRYIGLNRRFYHALYEQACLLRTENKVEQAESRYLCIDYKSVANETVFKSYVKSFIAQSYDRSLKDMDSGVKGYREQASDLFMINMMGLTPYGYLYMMVRNLMVDMNPKEEYLKRIVYVMYAKWGDFENGDINECLNNIWKTTEGAIFQMLLYYKQYSQLNEIIDKGLSGIIKESNRRDKDPSLLLNVLKTVRTEMVRYGLNNSEDILKDKDNTFRIGTDLTHQIHIMEYLSRLKTDSEIIITGLEKKKKYLQEDLKLGSDTIEKWYKEWDDEGDDNDSNIKYYFTQASRFFNEPEMRYDKQTFIKFSEQMMESVQFLFYSLKYDIKRIIEENEKTK